jgi:hypothetical protein
LTYLLEKYAKSYVLSTVRDGVATLRGPRYSYRMPSFGADAEALVTALGESDGDLPIREETVATSSDPTLGSLTGSTLAGFQGYACVSCHVWNGKLLADPDPGAVGTDLTRVAGRIRRDWFGRFLTDPARFHPNTPMPAIFPQGKRAALDVILDGDAARQKEALWQYFALGKDAPNPKPAAPLPVTVPGLNDPPIVAQIPVRLPNGELVESICVLYGSHDLLVYDLASRSLHSIFTGAAILRQVQGRLRTNGIAGTPVQWVRNGKDALPKDASFLGYDRLPYGVAFRWLSLANSNAPVVERFELVRTREKRQLVHEAKWGEKVLWLHTNDLPPMLAPATLKHAVPADSTNPEGSLSRPGYRAIAYPRPKTLFGDDLIMPGAVAVNPGTGRVYIASMKMGELFALDDPTGDGKQARFVDYGHGLFQDALSMHAEADALYVLHRRNLTKITETRQDGVADRFDRVAALPHGVADTYDYGYGLVGDKTGAFVMTYAPYANRQLPGSGGAIRLVPGQKPEEIAFGFRNPLGWCTGPEHEIFFTDNQGEWVATNKLCHIVKGRYYGFPNPAQTQHTTKPKGKTAVWVPYGWAHSINGVTYDASGGKFGPFAGQFFLAELMYGGGIIRAQVEKVNGEYQGACFPFWGKGLLGPLTLAFDPRGRLFVGGITEPGWMAMPDRGALFRIDFTGQMPFEIQAIHARPDGFEIVFTLPVAVASARSASSYQLEHYRYEYTGAYGSPELDRTRVEIKSIDVSDDGRQVRLTTVPLVKDRVYSFKLPGVRTASGEALVNPMAAYTLNEIPAEASIRR